MDEGEVSGYMGPGGSDRVTPVYEDRGMPAPLSWTLLYGCAVLLVAMVYRNGMPNPHGEATIPPCPFSPWLLLLAVPVLGTAGGGLAWWNWAPETHGPRFPRWAAGFGAAVGATTGVWLTYVGVVGFARAIGVFLIGWVVVGGLFAVVYYIADRVERRPVRVPNYPPVDALGVRWRRILDDADWDDATMVGRSEHRAGLTIRVRLGGAMTVTEAVQMGRKVATVAAREYRRVKEPLPPNAIRIEPGDSDDEVLLHVTTKLPLNNRVAYTPDVGPSDVRQDIMVGEYESGAKVLMRILAAHWLIVATTGGGKSVLANNIIARLSGCANALVWVGGTTKVTTLVWGWIEAWLRGEAAQPAIDRVATNADALRVMLRDAWLLCCERNERNVRTTSLDPTRDRPAVVLILEEATTSLEAAGKIRCHDGVERSAGQLVVMLARAGRSAGIRLILMSQTALTWSAWGAGGPEIIRLFAGRICLRTAQASDGMKMITGSEKMVDTTKLRDNRMIVQTDAATGRFEPAKAAYLDDADVIVPIGARHAEWRPDGVEVDLSPEYTARWSAAVQPELARAAEYEGMEWPTPVHAELVPPVAEAEADEVPEAHATPSGDDSGLPPLTDDDRKSLERGLHALLRDNSPRPPSATSAVVDRLFPKDGPAEASGPSVPSPVPGSPLRAVVAWLDRMEVPDEAYVLTTDAAEGIGWDDKPENLGRALRAAGVDLRNTPRSAGFNQKRGFRAGDARQAAR